MPDKLTREQVVELRATILARGITLEGLSEATGLSEDVIQWIMQGRLRPELHIRQRLAEALGIDPRRLT